MHKQNKYFCVNYILFGSLSQFILLVKPILFNLGVETIVEVTCRYPCWIDLIINRFKTVNTTPAAERVAGLDRDVLDQ